MTGAGRQNFSAAFTCECTGLANWPCIRSEACRQSDPAMCGTRTRDPRTAPRGGVGDWIVNQNDLSGGGALAGGRDLLVAHAAFQVLDQFVTVPAQRIRAATYLRR